MSNSPAFQAALNLASGNVADALETFRLEAIRNPSYKTFVNLAAAERASGLLEDASRSAWAAIKIDQRRFEAWHNLGNVRTDMGQFDHALDHYSRALARATTTPDVPESAQRQIALAFATANMRLRNFREAWPAWEIGRLEAAWWPLPGTKIWAGERAESIAVICEGGFGDAMLFGRWLPLVKERVKRVRLMLWRPLVNWRDWTALGVDEVIVKEDGVDPTGTEFSISWMSLPGVFGMRSVADIPADTGLEAYPPHHFPYHGPPDRIGFCWHAEEAGNIRSVRAIPTQQASEIARDLFCNGKFDVVSLVPQGKQLYRAAEFKTPDYVLQDDALINTWEVTTEFIRTCRAVVTVDTAAAHLAGLCGVPTLLILPCASDWKWGTSANTPTDPWYGSHVRYFRNQDPLAWDVPGIQAAVRALLSGGENATN
jgi:hypothetical protein